MIIKAYTCQVCSSDHLVKYGRTAKGTQRYKCCSCQAIRTLEADTRYSQTMHDQVIQAYQERGSFRGVARTFGVSHVTVMHWVKKSADASPVQTKLTSGSFSRHLSI